MFGFMLYGLGIGMGYYPILKTTWKYFPEKKGFLTGFILSVFGLCPMAFTSIADAVINPEGKSMVNDIFPEEVANNMKTFALIMAITMGICGILSQILMFPLDNIITTDKNTDETNKNKQVSYVSNEIFDSEKIEEKELTEETEQKIEDINEPFNQAFKSWRFHLFNIMSVGTLCKFILIYKKNILIYIVFGFFSTNTSRPFGSKKLGNREIELQTMSKVCGLLNGVFRIIWGFVYDWLGFKIPYTIVTTLQVGVSATFYFSASNIYTYYITNILENLVFSGHGTIAPPIVSKIF
jgi:OFA family oxalate/formate antiporter-like MFS transporter